MSDFLKYIPEHIRSLGGYAPGKPIKQAEKESGVKMEKMASNENPFGPSSRAIEAMRAAADSVFLYPDNEATDLRNALAAKFNMDPEQVLTTTGSTQFLDVIAHTLLGPGLNAVTSERSFIVYKIATNSTGADLIQVPMRGDAFDLDGILKNINRDTRVVFIANPNNPTGTIVDPLAMDRFIASVPDHVLVVLDEAYYEFADYFARQRAVEYTHSLDYVRQGRNVVVLRTFSKAQGLAGVRVGYGFGDAELLRVFNKVRVAFSVSALGEAAALAALQDEEHVRKTVENNAAGAAYLTRKLSDLGLRVVPTWSNFLFVEAGEGALEITRELQASGIIVRAMGGVWGAPNAFRVSVGTPAQNEKFIAALSRVMETRTVAK